jgi:hypothetical protein
MIRQGLKLLWRLGHVIKITTWSPVLRHRSSILPQAPDECRRHPPIKDHFRPEPEHECK